MIVTHVVGARPNFMKAAPVMNALEGRGVRQQLIHTGQHYDAALSESIFHELGLPQPDVNLGVGSGTHAEQTAAILTGVERALLRARPDLMLVYGDVNSTVAAALAAAKLGVAVGHVEAGLRSRDLSMPEEINRLVTDRLSQMLFTPSMDANENLLAEGIEPERIHFVGNVMIDTLMRLLPLAESSRTLEGQYVLVTLHRPSNVDDPERLAALLAALEEIAATTAVVFPMHPRTRARVKALPQHFNHVRVTEPAGYLEFLALQRHAAAVITDSGGIQEETTFLGVPCLTLRTTTERPVTLTAGTNLLLGDDLDRLKIEVRRILSGTRKAGTVPPLWDGRAASRIADIISERAAA